MVNGKSLLAMWWGLAGITYHKLPLRIVKYVPWRAHFISLPMIPWTPWYKGTFLESWFIWIQIVVWITYLSILGWIDRPGADVLRKTQASVDLQSLVTFLLGLYVSLVLARWWNMRSAYQTVMGRTADTAIMLAAYLQAPTPAEEGLVDDARKTIIRYLNLAHALLVQQLANHFDTQTLIEKSLMTSEEWKILETSGTKYVLCYYWAATLMRWCAENGLMSQPEVMLPLMHKNISKLRGSAGDITMHVSTQLPMCYIQLLSLAVDLALFVLMNSLAKVEFLQRYLTGALRFQMIFWPWFLAAMWTVCYQGLLVLQKMFENPFTHRASSFPVEKHVDDTFAFTNKMVAQRAPFELPLGKADKMDDAEIVAQSFGPPRAIQGSPDSILGIEIQRHPYRILRYNSAKTQFFSALMFIPFTQRFKGTFLGTRHLWILLVFWCGLLSWFGFSEDPVARTIRQPDADSNQLTTSDADIIAKYSDAVKTLSTSFSKVQKLAIFLLGLYVSLVLARWWSMRELYQLNFGRTKDTAMMIAAYIRAPMPTSNSVTFSADEETGEVRHIRMRLVRYLCLAHGLILQQAKGTQTIDDLMELQKQGLLNDDEMKVLEPIGNNRYAFVYFWVATLLRHCSERGLLPDKNMFTRLQKQISKLRGSAGDLLGLFLGCQLPYCYIQIVSYTVQVFLFVNVSQLANSLNAAVDMKDEVSQTAGIFWPYFTMVTTVVAFESFLILNIYLNNPFGDSALHFPTERMFDELWHDCVRVLFQPSWVASLDPFNDTDLQMPKTGRKKFNEILRSKSFWAKIMGVLLYAEPLHIYKYVPWKLHAWSLMPLIPTTPWWKGTIIESPRFLLQLLFWAGWLSWIGFTDNNSAKMLRKVGSPSNVQSLVTFLLGMAISLLLGRWWTMREKYNIMLSGTNEVAVMATVYIRAPDGSISDDAEHMRRKIIRYCNLGQRLLLLQAREEGEEGIEQLVDEGLMTREEFDVIKHSEVASLRYTIAYFWAAWHIRWCAEHDMMLEPASILTRMQSALTKVRTTGGDVLTLLNSQVPYCYVQVLSWCVNVFLFMVTCYTANKLSEAKNWSGAKRSSEYLWSYLEVFLRVSVFTGIPVLFGFFDNPFGDDAADFPVEKYSQDLWIQSNDVIGEASQLPTLEESRQSPGSMSRIPIPLDGSPNCRPGSITSPPQRPVPVTSPSAVDKFLKLWSRFTGVTTIGRWSIFAKYNTLRILTYKAPMLHFLQAYAVIPWTPWWSGSYLSTPFMWIMLVFWLAYVSWVGFSNDAVARTLRLCVPDVALKVSNAECSKWDLNTINDVQNLTNFLVGFYISLVLGRWWKMREKYQVVNRCNDMAVMIGAYIRPRPGGTIEEALKARKTIIRYANLMQSLVLLQCAQAGCNKMQSKDDSVFDARTLIDKGIMTIDEWEILEEKPAKHLIACVWLTSALQDCAEKGLLAHSKTMLPRILTIVHKGRNASNELLMFLNTQLPLAYLQLLSYVIHIFLLFQISFLAYRLEVAMGQPIKRDKAIGIFWAYFSTVTWTLTFEGLLVLHIFFANPFGSDPTHFPSEKFRDDTWAGSNAMIDRSAYPPQIEASGSPAGSANQSPNCGKPQPPTMSPICLPAVSLSDPPKKPIQIATPDPDHTENKVVSANTMIPPYMKTAHSRNEWHFGVDLIIEPTFAIISYRSHYVNYAPFVPQTPFFRGVFMGSYLLWIQLAVWAALLSWFSFSDDSVATSLRKLEVSLPPSIFSLITFILGLYVSLVLGRWWRMRELYQGVFGNSVEMALTATVYIRPTSANPTDRDYAEAAEIRDKIVRYLNLAHTLFFQQAASKFDGTDLIQRNICTEEEWQKMEPLASNKYLIPYLWIAQLCRHGSETELMVNAEQMLPRFQMLLSKMRGGCGDNFMFFGSQLPYCYIQLLSFAVHVFMFVIVCSEAKAIQSYLDDPKNGSIIRTGTVFWGYVEMIIFATVFEGLLVLHCMLINPWDPKQHARFPTEKYATDLINATTGLLNQFSVLPFPTEPRKGFVPLRLGPSTPPAQTNCASAISPPSVTKAASAPPPPPPPPAAATATLIVAAPILTTTAIPDADSQPKIHKGVIWPLEVDRKSSKTATPPPLTVIEAGRPIVQGTLAIIPSPDKVGAPGSPTTIVAVRPPAPPPPSGPSPTKGQPHLQSVASSPPPMPRLRRPMPEPHPLPEGPPQPAVVFYSPTRFSVPNPTFSPTLRPANQTSPTRLPNSIYSSPLPMHFQPPPAMGMVVTASPPRPQQHPMPSNTTMTTPIRNPAEVKGSQVKLNSIFHQIGDTPK